MYARYAGLIFDMDGTLLDTEPTHRKAWREVLGRYGLRFDEQAMVALNGSPTWLIAQSIIELNHADLDPLSLAREKTDAVKSILLDCVEPLPLVEVVKAWHGRRPMSVGTGSESAIAEALLAHLGLRRYLMRLWRQITYSITNPRLTPSYCAPSGWASCRRSAWYLKMPILVYRRRGRREWMPWMSDYCE